MFTYRAPEFWPQRETQRRKRSGLAMVDEWWPELGRMHVADGEKTGQPEWDSEPHSQAIMGRHEYYCGLLSVSKYSQKLVQHTENIRAKR